MPRYRKKPIIVKAEQYLPEQGQQPTGLVYIDPSGERALKPYIKTLEGWMTVSPGDWIITGIKGERYPCKPGIFAATYEKVDDHA